MEEQWKQFFKSEKISNTIHVIKSETFDGARSYIQSAYKRFKRFGLINTIRTGCVDCLFVEYKDAKDAAKLLKMDQIEIDHCNFKIFSAMEFHDEVTGYCTHSENINSDQTENPSTIVVKDASNTSLDDINDDCLRGIFRHIHRSVDFCRVAYVCKWFNRIALEIFPLKIKQKAFSLSELAVNGDVKLWRLENFLTTFGSSIRSAHLDFNDSPLENTPNAMNLALKMINNHCKNLRSLIIYIGNTDNLNDWMEIRSVLPMLEYLKIDINRDVKTIGLLTDFISACCELKTLAIHCAFELTLVLPEIKFPKLINFKLPNYDGYDNANLERFLKHNTQLEKINCLIYHCRFIGLNMLNLQKLTVQVGRVIAEDVSDSNSLNENVKMKLENLLTDGEDIDYICQLKNITILRAEVWTPFRANHLISLARSQKELRKLTLEILDPEIKYPIDLIKPMLRYADKLAEIRIICRNGFSIRFSDKDFEILKFVERRNNSIKLDINITDTLHYSSGKWKKEKIIVFNDKTNRLNVISHYISYY